MIAVSHSFKCQMVAVCPHFQTSQCENQTTRWKDQQKVFDKSKPLHISQELFMYGQAN